MQVGHAQKKFPTFFLVLNAVQDLTTTNSITSNQGDRIKEKKEEKSIERDEAYNTKIQSLRVSIICKVFLASLFLQIPMSMYVY